MFWYEPRALYSTINLYLQTQIITIIILHLNYN
jgi:hypothetical protein